MVEIGKNKHVAVLIKITHIFRFITFINMFIHIMALSTIDTLPLFLPIPGWGSLALV